MARQLPPPETCAQCGADIPPRAHACPGCGADERTGWREASVYDGLELPDEDATRGANGGVDPRRSSTRLYGNGLRWYWFVVAAALLALLAMGGLGLL